MLSRSDYTDLLVGEHEWNGAIQSHTVVQVILKHVKIVKTVRLPTAGKRMM